METHPNGNRARILLNSVFGPYAQDDEFGSRSINPMELYHNQVTRAQGSFSLRMLHRPWGIMMGTCRLMRSSPRARNMRYAWHGRCDARRERFWCLTAVIRTMSGLRA